MQASSLHSVRTANASTVEGEASDTHLYSLCNTQHSSQTAGKNAANAGRCSATKQALQLAAGVAKKECPDQFGAVQPTAVEQSAVLKHEGMMG